MPPKAGAKRSRGPGGPRTPKKASRQASLQRAPVQPDVADSDTSDASYSSAAPAATTQPRPPLRHRPPPIHLDKDWGEEHFKKYDLYSEGLLRPFLCKLAARGGGLVIRAQSMEDYESLLKRLKENGEEYTTQTPRNQRTERLVATRLPTGITTEYILHTLREAQLPVQAAHRLTARDPATGQPRALTAVVCTFTAGTPIKKVSTAVPAIAGCSTRWQRYNAKGVPVQCFRCQKFTHASKNCNRQVSCRKCGGPHKSGDCLDSQPNKCANCGEAHRSTYKGCKHYQEVVLSMQAHNSSSRRARAAQGRLPSHPAAPQRQPDGRNNPAPPSPTRRAPPDRAAPPRRPEYRVSPRPSDTSGGWTSSTHTSAAPGPEPSTRHPDGELRRGPGLRPRPPHPRQDEPRSLQSAAPASPTPGQH